MNTVFELIKADRANPVIQDAMLLYGKLIGSWRVESTWFDKGVPVRNATGEWHFTWILGGNGIQDVLFADGFAKEKYGTTIRCYDSQSGYWRATWMQPGYHEFAQMIGRYENNEIVQEIMGLTGKREIWRFKDITENEFTWLDQVSFDDGKTWTVEQEMRCHRFKM